MSLYYWLSMLPVVALLALYIYLLQRAEHKNSEAREQAIAAGLAEPASLHPLIDHSKCIGCKSCVYICPQQLGHRVLGIYRGKAELLEAANCIGHGACKTVCPVDAITLVFGTAERGVDIPQLDDSFETNVAGIYIAGELGGMGLIRNAIEQGKMAVRALAQSLPKTNRHDYQLIIVGAGPAGISATLQAQDLGLKYLTLDQESLGGTVFKYPRGKIVMTQPIELPLVGKMDFRETSKEELLEFWRQTEVKSGIRINYSEAVSGISALDPGYSVTTSEGSYSTDTVLLAIGRRGTPRKLGVPGEEQAKVVYQLIDPEQYSGQQVLIVGGGDSALEAALAIADAGVAVSYRGESFSRARAKNRERIEAYAAGDKIKLYLSSTVSEIAPQEVLLDQQGQALTISNDAVIVSAGGILPTAFLRQIGIEVETRYGTA